MDDLWDLLEFEETTSSEEDVEDLVKQLEAADNDYYNGTPSLSDPEYEALKEKLQELDPNNSYFKNVGASVDKSHWEKVTHRAPMGSLNKAKNETEFAQWVNRCAKPDTLAVSEKCDGISISLWYDNGELTKGVTRGDGTTGEDITRNVIKMKGIKTKIPGLSGEIRGEIVLTHEDWKEHFPDTSNPRNTASGTAKRLDGTGCEHLTILQYEILRADKPILSKITQFKALKALGCAVPRFYVARKQEDVNTIYQAYIDTVRGELNYDIDGLVIEYDDRNIMDDLGEHNKRPKGAIAYKFPDETASTSLLDIQWQTGGTGRVTPVALFNPVILAGATVSKASLYNVSYIEGLGGLAIGDKVLVSRRNDVIPRVEKVISSEATEKLETPLYCKECDTPLTQEGEFLLCTNTFECPAQISGAVKKWIVDGLGLKGWGDAIILGLCEKGYVQTPADLYYLQEKEFAALTLSGSRVGTTASKLLKSLHENKKLLLHNFVGSLCIPLCARSFCKILVEAGYDTLEKMQQASSKELQKIQGVGEAKADSFVKGMVSRRGLILALLKAGVEIKPPAEGPLKGLSVCMTGFRDPRMEKAIEEAGGTLKRGVTKKLSILVAADPKSTSGKAKKARTYGIDILSPAEMWEKLEN